MLQLLESERFRSFALASVKVYLAAAGLTVVVAHVLIIAAPTSGWAQRVILPLTNGLEFADIHWKSLLLLLAFPFAAPLIPELVRRLKKIGIAEFGPDLEEVGKREKPTRMHDGKIHE